MFFYSPHEKKSTTFSVANRRQTLNQNQLREVESTLQTANEAIIRSPTGQPIERLNSRRYYVDDPTIIEEGSGVVRRDINAMESVPLIATSVAVLPFALDVSGYRNAEALVESIVHSSNNNVITNNNTLRRHATTAHTSTTIPHIHDTAFGHSPVSSVISAIPDNITTRRLSKAGKSVLMRRPTISIQEDGRIVIDHIGSRWDGIPLTSQSGLIDEDGATIMTDTLKEEGDRKEPLTCPQQVIKYIKILIPHIILVSVLIGYLCFGAWILMLLETRTELMARSRKLVRLTNLMTNFTSSSWKILNDAQSGVKSVHHNEWTTIFREYMLSVSEVVDDRRPIRRELNQPDNLDNMHNKWTFPTALLYVLTVLTTCGYGEVSVDTDTGKIFSVAFALVGIPLMFITAADIGKFLSETLLKFVNNWNRMTRQLKHCCQKIFCRKKYVRRKSMAEANGNLETLEMLGIDGAEEKLWFPIGAYVGCICLYCSMGSAMFINWERAWSFIHAFHFGFNLIVTVGLGDIVVVDYVFLSLIVAFVIVGLSVVTMCVDLASTHLKAYFTRIHYFGRAKRFLGMSEELKEIVALLGAMRKKKGGKVTWNDVRDFLDNELRDRPFEPHDLLLKMRFIDETTSQLNTIRHNSFQSDFFRDNEYVRRLAALRPEQPAYL
uniref:Uncoordinated protein 58 n=1 Tax=Rhabditophanes sp. KR3021 TaxID=114890 RepID=A0AC35U7L9_9BILA